ncbi:MAG: nucleotidyltransferase family protein [Desulfuromonadaceae bacterium]
MNYYETLAAFLSPRPDEARIDRLRTLLRGRADRLKWLLYTANLHLCTPLWFVCLRRDGLLGELPADLQAYLQQLYLANTERNAELKTGLRELIGELDKGGIETLLLKGAASFGDDLYGDPGARVMGDLDLLVKPQRGEAARTVLLRLGYEKAEEEGLDFDQHPRDYQHFHLPAYRRPGTPLVVEIHTGLGHGQVARLLPATAVWEDAEPLVWEGRRTHFPGMEWRLLHNIAHALVPHREFIRSCISLRQLAEFGFLVQANATQLDWSALEQRLGRYGLRREFSTYLTLAQRLLGLARPDGIGRSIPSSFHVLRCSLAGNDEVRHVAEADSGSFRAGFWLRRVLFRGFFWMNLPVWVWRNARYPQGTKTVPARLKHLFARLFDPQSRKDTGC